MHAGRHALTVGFRYSMEFLISSACLAFTEEGCQLVSLSGAPWPRAGASDSAMDQGPLDSFLDRLGSRLEPYYGFQSLHAFKNRFQPRFEPLFLVLADEAALPRKNAETLCRWATASLKSVKAC